jgi:hypothetical protein
MDLLTYTQMETVKFKKVSRIPLEVAGEHLEFVFTKESFKEWGDALEDNRLQQVAMSIIKAGVTRDVNFETMHPAWRDNFTRPVQKRFIEIRAHLKYGDNWAQTLALNIYEFGHGG